ncbi:YbdK family carboxylate-amine ligase [Nocardioides anomalus]|uniref:Putative glutamate--cysteine ligase 2 n=1 Tax=Nocardioides anomalus TaxID=2712223 RepID=A0A6G6WC49_9ACTN|nr:glutamate--cysteine ligase [Nocardioides anomalus]QIG42675.1 YbdK family carboxylate-amine ligase [Nocardioides anomalus]
MDTRTVGVEEELLVVDPATRIVTSRARQVLKTDAERGTHSIDQELFRHMVELRTEPTVEIAEIVRQVVTSRREAQEAASAHDLAVAACAAAPTGLDRLEVTPDSRYADMMVRYGHVARLGTTCGMHVHVWIASEEEGVACLDRIAPWLPVLLAVSANSPYAEGSDTGYASWRTQQWSTWPSAGPTEAFGSVAGYRRACERMIASGAARDTGMLYFDARLSERHPTLEVRILDVATDVEDTGLLAALVRGLVETAAEGSGEEASWRAEELRAARWRASRYGLADDLLDPVTHELRPAREVLERLVEHVRTRVDRAGDSERVRNGVERVLSGTGATRQRAAYERSGAVEGVVDDVVTRTHEAWASPEPAGRN